jgi:hypothetical protein
MKRLLALGFLIVSQAIAAGSEADEQLILATYKLFNERSTATCLVVSRPGNEEKKTAGFIVTADHVFDQMGGNSCQLVARSPEKNGAYTRKEFRIEIRQNGKNLWQKHPRHDLAILRLPDDVEIASLPVGSLVTEEALKKIHSGDSVRLAVFPEQTESNGAGFPILRTGVIASFPLNPAKLHPMFLVDTTTWAGDSGGPVIHASQLAPGGHPLVIGFVHGMRNITDTVKESRRIERKTNYPLNISEVTQAVFVWEMLAKIDD